MTEEPVVVVAEVPESSHIEDSIEDSIEIEKFQANTVQGQKETLPISKNGIQVIPIKKYSKGIQKSYKIIPYFGS